MTRLIQYRDADGRRAVAITENGGPAHRLDGTPTTYQLALDAARGNRPLAELANARRTAEIVDLDAADAEGRLLLPLDHPDPARCWVTGTGLTHLGGAAARNQMHEKLQGDEAAMTDSMKMFKWGVEGGKPAAGVAGVQPEWFFKGNGFGLIPPGGQLPMPGFAHDGGEEPEVAGLYVIAEDGTPLRVGFAIGNEFSDHAMEALNYLYLAHSKLRPCAVGPEMLVGPLPQDIRGTSRITRAGRTVWEKPFISGEANMSHWIANLEHHHFKYGMFCRPGDVHVHFFGTSTLSSQDGFRAEPGDVFEVASPVFGRPLRNPLACEKTPPLTVVRAL